jgi:mannitol-1-phosphate 5-dehydrogenase
MGGREQRKRALPVREQIMAAKIVLFGAGATGRGHVGLLAWQAGFEMVFVDKKPDLVKVLQDAGRYVVKMYGGKEHGKEIVVRDYRVYHYLQREAIASEVVDAALVLTAVFDPNLADVAETLALAVGACRKAGRSKPLNCIACENMMDSSSTLGKHVRSHLKGEDLAYCEKFFGFPDCMISRVVPRPEPDPLVILTEDYNEWTTRAESFKGSKPVALTALELVNNQTARLERKLMIHNGGHAVCGYTGFHRGHEFIHEAVADPVVVQHVQGAIDEIGEVIKRKHGFSAESIEAYKRDLGRRGAIAELRDQILRVVRDPIRKLSDRERLVAPAKLAVEYGMPRRWIVKGIVAALMYQHPNDRESVQLKEQLEREGLEATLRKVCSIDASSPLAGEIAQAWKEWAI